MIAALFAKIASSRQWLTLVTVGAAAAFLYIQWSRVTGQRDAAIAWSEKACAAAGVAYAATTETVDGKAVRFATGQRCYATIVDLVAFRTDTTRVAAETLAAAMRDRDARTRTDAAHARAAAEAARAATERMETADAKAAPTDRVDGDWFAALNDLAGLRPAGAGREVRAGRRRDPRHSSGRATALPRRTARLSGRCRGDDARRRSRRDDPHGRGPARHPRSAAAPDRVA